MLDYAVADIVGVYLEVAFFGAYTVLFLLCMWVILKKRSLNYLLSSAAVVSYILSTLYVGLDLQRVARSYKINPEMPWVITYTANHNDNLDHIMSYTYIAESLIADAILIWRCYAVWGQDIRICLLSILLWFGTGIGGCGSVWYLSHSPQSGIIGPTAQRWGKAAIATAIATNVFTTSLIAGRIWWQKKSIQKAYGERMRYTHYYDRVITIIIESGAVWTAGLISELVLYTMNNTGTLVIVSILSQLVGIVPTTIIIYAALGRTTDSSKWGSVHADSNPSSEATSRGRRSSERDRQLVMDERVLDDQDDKPPHDNIGSLTKAAGAKPVSLRFAPSASSAGHSSTMMDTGTGTNGTGTTAFSSYYERDPPNDLEEGINADGSNDPATCRRIPPTPLEEGLELGSLSRKAPVGLGARNNVLRNTTEQPSDVGARDHDCTVASPSRSDGRAASPVTHGVPAPVPLIPPSLAKSHTSRGGQPWVQTSGRPASVQQHVSSTRMAEMERDTRELESW